MDIVKQIWDRVNGYKTYLVLFAMMLASTLEHEGVIEMSTFMTLREYLMYAGGATFAHKVDKFVRTGTTKEE